MTSDCSALWDIECLHGKWCLTHVNDHRQSDLVCDEQITQALCVFVTDGIMPLIKALSAMQKVSTARMEQQMFPIKISFVEIVGVWQESNRSICDVLEQTLDGFTAALRRRYEGEEMPYGLDDESAWQWYKE
jgi:hypothetical protein